MISARPEGPLKCFVGAFALLGSTIPRSFPVLVEYPTDQVRNDYSILALDRGSLHSYTEFGRAFELFIALAPVVGVLATLYGDVVDERAKDAANAAIASGVVALWRRCWPAVEWFVCRACQRPSTSADAVGSAIRSVHEPLVTAGRQG